MPLALRAAIRLAMVAATVVVGVAACDAKPASPASSGTDAPRQVTVVGSGKVQGTPDTLTVSASMEATAPDITAALNQTSQRQQAVITALGGAGVDKKDISTSQVSLQPQYNIDGSTISGYRASNSIEVKIRKIDTASNILSLIANTGGEATRINSINYSIEDDSQLVKDARTRAFNDAKDRADQYAQLSGLTLGKVISISETTGATPPPPPTPMPMPRAAMAEAVPLEPGQQTVGFSVTVVWELI
ncbi:SIMPL domain-containing protein [Mycolicibacterium fluoranthenivorans]|jgi:uncharacterized protein YggE|uniref:SIMPL domain-containing protein n=1 Tax=Mycolicibacterium fluoranthenivorans TaxID=258505 RepID=A0A1G4VGA5_9MYCO|nr:SIMPL domain-containing protein [Mycolicibacterium fluoranthenivorans]SCX06320.1 hypothetical protein SAMN02799620_00850 [Mycolicibacterium fluoranthenivorans]